MITIKVHLHNMPQRVKQITNVEHMYKNDFVMACYRKPPYDDNTLKTTTISSSFHAEFASTYYNDKGDVFRFIFGKFIKPYMKEIDHNALIQE